MSKQLDDRRESRVKKLSDLGLMFNGAEMCYEDINFHWTEILCDTDAEFDKAYAGAVKRMATLKQEEAHASQNNSDGSSS